MPNDCWNNITIVTRNSDELNNFINEEIKDHHLAVFTKRSRNGAIINIWSPNTLPREWLTRLLDSYPTCWIKNEWKEEAGMAGVWVGYVNENNQKVIKEFDWRDLSVDEEHFFFLDNMVIRN